MGTWALPQTTEQATALVELLKTPLKASEACTKLYSLLGDDDLGDQIGHQIQADGPDSDARCLVACAIEDTVIANAERAFKPYAPGTLELLGKAAHDFIWG